MPRTQRDLIGQFGSAAPSELMQFRPLAPELYRLLRHHCGGQIKIASPGEAFIADWVHDPRTNRSQLLVTSSGEYYRVNCPYCHDLRQRLWVSHYYGQSDPQGNIITHLACCYNEGCLQDYENRRQFTDTLFGFQNRNQRRPMLLSPTAGTAEPAGLFVARPPGTIVDILDLPPEHPAVQWLMRERAYTPHQIRKYRIGYCVEALPQYRPAQDRIYFPIYFEGTLKGWQCRYIGDINWKATGIPKYYTMPGFHKRLLLYNYDTAKDKDFIVVTEGVTDVHFVGDYSVSLLGKSLSFHQRNLLLQIGERKPIVLLLDPGTEDDVRGMIEELATAPGQHPVLSIRLPGEYDPADYRDRPTLWRIIQAQARERGVLLNFTS
jgi:hypothetical protein